MSWKYKFRWMISPIAKSEILTITKVKALEMNMLMKNVLSRLLSRKRGGKTVLMVIGCLVMSRFVISKSSPISSVDTSSDSVKIPHAKNHSLMESMEIRTHAARIVFDSYGTNKRGSNEWKNLKNRRDIGLNKTLCRKKRREKSRRFFDACWVHM